MTVLSVNLNKIALVRNSREGHRPSVVEAARTAIAAGAGGITVHPRPDMRHIRPHDVHDLAALLNDEYPQIEFNIEGNPAAGPTTEGYPGFDALIEATRPAQATLVPDSDDQLTSDHGFDLSDFDQPLAERIARYQALGARVSLFMDPIPGQIATAADIGADRIELYTETYARAHESGAFAETLEQFQSAAQAAAAAGLGINAGHDLNLDNLPDFDIPGLLEVSIGHALTVDALKYGFGNAIGRYLDVLSRA